MLCSICQKVLRKEKYVELGKCYYCCIREDNIKRQNRVRISTGENKKIYQQEYARKYKESGYFKEYYAKHKKEILEAQKKKPYKYVYERKPPKEHCPICGKKIKHSDNCPNIIFNIIL